MNSKTKIQEKNRMCEIDDHIFKYFEIKRRLGKGAYGIVWKALHRKTNQTVAVKKIFDAFRDETDAQRTFREIMFLRAFRDHPCIIQLHNVYKASNNLDIYLSFEFMESDLHNVIKKGNVLKDVHKRYIFYQLLNAISYIHSGNVIHRDLKPSNVLIDTKCNCKLADFGLARSVSNQQMRDATIDANESLEPMLTDYVATRWYRAPEILIASKRYTKGIDMWSLGCILGEMIRGKPIFQGNSTVDQIEKIVSALPEVTEKDIISVGAGFGSALLSKTIPGKSTTTLDELLIDGTNDANDLVKRLLVLDPMARLTAIESLGHKYVERFQDRIELIELNADVKPPFHDDIRLSVNEYRSKLYEIIQQTEKSTNNAKSYSLTRKREPSRTVINKSTDIIPSNLNTYEEKLKRNAYRSQECKPCLSNDVTSQSKATISRASNKVKITPPPPHMITANNGIYRNPKKQITSNLINDHYQPDSKIDAVLSKSKYSMQSSVRNGQSATSKNTSSSPELVGIQRFNSKSNMVVMEKRHSIDGSYNYVQPSNRLVSQHNQPAEKEKSVAMFSSHNNSHHLTNRQREKSKISTSGFRKSYQNINAYHDNQIVSSPSNKKSVPPSSTEDLTMLNDGSNYYVKRLKRLEEQIEKHKKEVKAFCSENSKNSKIIPSHKRQSESNVEQKITYKDKYFVNGNGNSKALQFHPKTDTNNSSKYYAKQGSSGRFDYLFVNDDHINHREAIVSKYGDKRPTKIM